MDHAGRKMLKKANLRPSQTLFHSMPPYMYECTQVCGVSGVNADVW